MKKPLSPLAQRIISHAELDADAVPKINRAMMNDRGDAFDATLAKDVTFTVAVPYPFALDELECAIEAACDTVAANALESHLDGFDAFNVRAFVPLDSISFNGSDDAKAIVTFRLAIDADLKQHAMA